LGFLARKEVVGGHLLTVVVAGHNLRIFLDPPIVLHTICSTR
jgi:hypothetical protein